MQFVTYSKFENKLSKVIPKASNHSLYQIKLIGKFIQISLSLSYPGGNFNVNQLPNISITVIPFSFEEFPLQFIESLVINFTFQKLVHQSTLLGGPRSYLKQFLFKITHNFAIVETLRFFTPLSSADIPYHIDYYQI